ncbi:hypothetical protein IFM89_038521 [Coptis chinensis]|uniref:SP-RING-type domain-containing protein n=1 Tax=Coptis chinensis TaxID=261450 RepID=A0A835IIE7_9MAGN|nr:hypothetical protein IFM89_038521 [Coptis chinensis]
MMTQRRAMMNGSTQMALPSVNVGQVNSLRIAAVADRLLNNVRPGIRFEPAEFFHLCISLARGIDFAIANDEIPAKSQELPSLLKMASLIFASFIYTLLVYQRKNDDHLRVAVMVLMISVKNACKNGWFVVQDADELLTLANEIGRSFCNPADINIEPSSLPHIISNVMSRFFPRMKIGNVLASLEVKPGFGAFVVDFHISKKASTAEEKIRLFVVQTDSISTSACLISPPKVKYGTVFLRCSEIICEGSTRNFIYICLYVPFSFQDTGPQLPTNVTAMLKYGTNLLQAIGQFNGHYIIAMAFMSTILTTDVPVLQDYVQPVTAAPESDSEITEGSSRMSLNCPISFTRMKTPVKGQLCKHHQCFDFENYIEINSRRPSWRCPHCNQSVCYMDIRIDQYMVKVSLSGLLMLRVIGIERGCRKRIDVIVSADGSWRPVMESTGQTNVQSDSTLGHDGSEQCESTRLSNTITNVVDLTVEGAEENDVNNTYETEDRKPLKDVLPGSSVAMVPLASDIMNTSEITPNHFPPIEDDFWSGISFTRSSTFNGSAAPTVSESPATNCMRTPLLQHSQEYCDSRQWLRNVSRTPVAVQALPAQSQVPATHIRARPNFISISGAYQTPGLPPTDVNGESERQQQFPQSRLNSPSAPDMGSYSVPQNWDHQGRPYIPSPLQQVVGLPATSQVPGSYRGSSGLPPPAAVQTSSHYHPLQVQQGGPLGAGGQEVGGASNLHNRLRAAANRSVQVARSPPAVPVQLQAPGSSFPMIVDGHRGINTAHVARSNVLNELPSDQNWRPAGRMRGALSGQAYSAALSQYMVQPTQSVQAASPPPHTAPPYSVSQQLQILISNNINSHGPSQQAQTRTGGAAAGQGHHP